MKKLLLALLFVLVALPLQAQSFDTDDGSVATGQEMTITIPLTYYFNGATWARWDRSVDVITLPAITFAAPQHVIVDSGSITFTNASIIVTATDLDIRNLVFATDKVDASGTTLGSNSGVDIGDVTINNASAGSAVNIQDGGNSITVDGTITVTDGAGALNVIVDSGTVTANQGTPNTTANRWPVQVTDGTDLAQVTATGGGSLQVECSAGCGSPATFNDNSSFTFGTSGVTNVGAVVDDTATNSVTENNAGAPRMSTSRVLYGNLRNSSGTEVVTSTVAPQTTDLALATRPTALYQTVTGVAVTVTDNTLTLNSAYSVCTIEVTGVWTGSVSFFRSVDGAFIREIPALNINTNAVERFSTVNDSWQADCAGMKTFVVSMVVTTGTMTVVIRAGPGKALYYDQPQMTYYAMTISEASATSKDYLTLFNGAGSGKVLSVLRIQISNHNTAAIAGVGATFNVNKVSTSGTTCTAKTIQLADTNSLPVPAQITALSNCTTDPTVTYTLNGCHTAVDETQVLNSPVDCYTFMNSSGQPWTLREGQGVSLFHTAAPAPVGLITVFIEFTM
jgi:hypothetical protein